ncbi:lytic transglycosylase domain-containing protein [Pigmentibacter sp. JX0631]|uniref:lytic transglycosylase domain-containing protein n=1 Tax=Pigmentibacter sp. JX0631 TaxID=2976982 RepID=UPI002469BEF8|nr:lytic transglycosylase domain-containing protein [Pigmentibacter sp. JX0631]WGL58966.1 lytic transglycosylase domain-containing protein [Pigmentibacter sp. JX0631]
MLIKIKKKNIFIFCALIIVPFALLQVSCSSNTILTENLELTLPEQKQMLSSIKRKNDNFYLSNLKDYSSPKESQLINEAQFKNLAVYNENVRVLSDWVLRSLSQKEKTQLSRNCEALVGNFKNQFPLNEQTLPCAAWWIERKNNEESTSGNKIPIQQNYRTLLNKQKLDIANYRSMSFSEAFSIMEPANLAQAQKLTASALDYLQDCSYAGANSALLLRLEAFLPNKSVYNDIERIYSKMQKCLLPNMDPTEKIHLRIGLLRLISGHPNLAKEALEKTLLEKEPIESSRSLFWLGAIYQKSKTSPKENPYWQRLIKENPISLPAIFAAQQLGIDPMNNLVPDEEIALQARDSSGWSDDNLEAFVFDLFKARNDISAATEWASYVGRTSSVSNPNMLLYWALAQNSVRNYRYSIFMLGRYGKSIKNYPVSRTLLNLHFPKPYLKEIAENSEDLDPIFVLSLIRQESAFDTYARSLANARGLMQVLPSTAKSIKRKISSNHLYDPETNIEIGVSYLSRLLKRYDGRIEYVLASYNAGASNLDKWRERVPENNMMLFCDYMPFKETRSYVSLILRNYYWYSRIISEKDDLFTKKILQQSAKARWRSDRVYALVAYTWNSEVDLKYKNILEKIYIFGNNSANISSNPNTENWLNEGKTQNRSYSNLDDEKTTYYFNKSK